MRMLNALFVAVQGRTHYFMSQHNHMEIIEFIRTTMSSVMVEITSPQLFESLLNQGEEQQANADQLLVAYNAGPVTNDLQPSPAKQ